MTKSGLSRAKRVAVVFADPESRRRLRDASVPCRDGARGVPGPHATERCQVSSQPRDFAGGDFGDNRSGKNAPGNKCGTEAMYSLFHVFHDGHDLVGPQNEYFRDAEMKSRSLSA